MPIDPPSEDEIREKVGAAGYLVEEFKGGIVQEIESLLNQSYLDTEHIYGDFHDNIMHHLCDAGNTISGVYYEWEDEIQRALAKAYGLAYKAGADLPEMSDDELYSTGLFSCRQLGIDQDPEGGDEGPQGGGPDHEPVDSGGSGGEPMPPEGVEGRPPVAGGVEAGIPMAGGAAPVNVVNIIGGVGGAGPQNPANPNLGAKPGANIPPNAGKAPGQPQGGWPFFPGRRPKVPFVQPQGPGPKGQGPQNPNRPGGPGAMPADPTGASITTKGTPPDGDPSNFAPIDPGSGECPDVNITIKREEPIELPDAPPLPPVAEANYKGIDIGGKLSVPSTGETLLDRSHVSILLSIRPTLINFGKLIITFSNGDNALYVTTSKYVDEVLSALKIDGMRSLTNLIVASAKNTMVTGSVERAISAWLPTISARDSRFKEETLPLLALREYLFVAASLATSVTYGGGVGFGRDHSENYKLEGSVSIDGMLGKGSRTPIGQGKSKTSGFGVGGNAGASANAVRSDKIELGTDSNGTMRGEIRMIVVPILDVLDRLIDSTYAQSIPTVDQIISSYLRGSMTEERAAESLQFHGMAWGDFKELIRSRRNAMSSTELVVAYRRKYLDREQFYNAMRSIGWTDTKEIQVFEGITTYVPPVTDVIRMMVRDVEDGDMVDRFKLDEEFDQKYHKLLEDYGEANGLDRETAKRYWRAHWRLPGMAQALEAMHRCRPGTEAARIAGRVVEQSDVDAMLAMDDLMPGWRGPMRAISYRPLTRVDAQRSYIIGVIDEKGLEAAYRDLHYPEANAKILVKWTEERRIRWIARYPAVKAHVSGALSEDQLSREIARFNWTDEQVREAISRLKNAKKAKSAERCETALRRQYLTGKFDRASMIERLMGFGYDKARADELIEQWKCEAKVNERAVPATTLCRWYKASLISKEEYIERLIRIGYAKSDALVLSKLCEQEKDRDVKRQEEMDAKRKQREEATAKRRREQAEAKAESAAKRAEREIEREAKAEARRKKRQRAAVKRIAKLVLVSEEAAAGMLEAKAESVSRDNDFTTVEAQYLTEWAALKSDYSTAEEFMQAVEEQVDVELQLDGAP